MLCLCTLAMNSTPTYGQPFSDSHFPLHMHVPFYYVHRPSLVSGISDHILALASPIIAYWAFSLLFHFLDISGWQWLEKYRIHESKEVQSRNRASPSQVVWGVLLQQLIQTTLGLYWLSGDSEGVQINHQEKMEEIARFLVSVARLVSGTRVPEILPSAQDASVYFLYWWGIPFLQFFLAM
jgi:sphinganine C4-monooxygenase